MLRSIGLVAIFTFSLSLSSAFGYDADVNPDGSLNLSNTEMQYSQEGRTWLFMSTAASALYVYNDIFKVIGENISDNKRLGLALLSTGVTSLGTYSMTESINLNYGRVLLMNYGGALGYIYPHLFAEVLHYATGVDETYQLASPVGSTYKSTDLTSNKIAAYISLFTFPFGIHAASQADVDNVGQAMTVMYMSQTVGALGYVFPLYFINPNNKEEYDDYRAASAVMSMILIPTGFSMGKSIVETNAISSGRGPLLYYSGALGTATGFLFPLMLDAKKYMTDVDYQYFTVTTSLAGYFIGTTVGFALKENENVTVPQSILMSATSILGALVGTGIPLAMESNNEKTIMAGGVLGGWLGLALGSALSSNLHEGGTTSYSNANSSKRNYSFSLPAITNLPFMAMNSKNNSKRQYELASFKMKF